MLVDDTSLKHRFTFKKAERLSSKKLIDELFKNGSFFILYPFKVQWMETTRSHTSPVQVLMSVPNRNFPNAADRNRIRRYMRESYRHGKHLLYETLIPQHKKLILAIIYTAKLPESFEVIDKKVHSILKRLAETNGPSKQDIR